MTIDGAVDLVREALQIMLMASAPILIAGLLIGLAVSIVQAVTQIQEQTLSFVPKIIGMIVITLVAAPWLFKMLMEFSTRMFAGE